MVPTTAPWSLMPNTRGMLNSWLGRPGGRAKAVSTPLDHSASERDPYALATPPATTPLLFRASPPMLENGMKGSGVTSYRSAARQEFMVSRCSMAFQNCCVSILPVPSRHAETYESAAQFAQFYDERPRCAHSHRVP